MFNKKPHTDTHTLIHAHEDAFIKDSVLGTQEYMKAAPKDGIYSKEEKKNKEISFPISHSFVSKPHRRALVS